MAVDKVLAKTVHQEAERSRQETAEALDKFPLTALIDYLRAKGYEVKLEGTCSSCGKLIDGPHFCPGPGGLMDRMYERDPNA